MFQVKVPEGYMTVVFMLVRGNNNKFHFDLEQEKDIRLKEELLSWLENNCVGEWNARTADWSIEFEKQEDYTNYNLVWG